eukprot:1161596-Pelagomonas_calceolata.AAC.10
MHTLTHTRAHRAYSTRMHLYPRAPACLQVILVRENQGCIECVRWEPGRNRVLDLKHSAQECQEPLDVTCWWGIKPKDSSPSDLDAAIVAAVGVEPLVGLLDSPQPHEQEAAAAAMCKLACSKSSKRFWRGEIAAAGALPGLQRVAGVDRRALQLSVMGLLQLHFQMDFIPWHCGSLKKGGEETEIQES